MSLVRWVQLGFLVIVLAVVGLGSRIDWSAVGAEMSGETRLNQLIDAAMATQDIDIYRTQLGMMKAELSARRPFEGANEYRFNQIEAIQKEVDQYISREGNNMWPTSYQHPITDKQRTLDQFKDPLRGRDWTRIFTSVLQFTIVLALIGLIVVALEEKLPKLHRF